MCHLHACIHTCKARFSRPLALSPSPGRPACRLHRQFLPHEWGLSSLAHPRRSTRPPRSSMTRCKRHIYIYIYVYDIIPLALGEVLMRRLVSCAVKPRAVRIDGAGASMRGDWVGRLGIADTWGSRCCGLCGNGAGHTGVWGERCLDMVWAVA